MFRLTSAGVRVEAPQDMESVRTAERLGPAGTQDSEAPKEKSRRSHPGHPMQAPPAGPLPPACGGWDPEVAPVGFEVRPMVDMLWRCDGCQAKVPIRTLRMLRWPGADSLPALRALCPACRRLVAEEG